MGVEPVHVLHGDGRAVNVLHIHIGHMNPLPDSAMSPCGSRPKNSVRQIQGVPGGAPGPDQQRRAPVIRKVHARNRTIGRPWRGGVAGAGARAGPGQSARPRGLFQGQPDGDAGAQVTCLG